MDPTHSKQIPEGPEPRYDRVVSGYETFHHREPFACEWGGVLPELTVAYETWGELSPARDNAVLLHTGLSASSHARSQPANPEPGWWEDFVGPGSAIDTDHFFVICTNLLGGCYGTTGPSSPNPATSQPYATDFPIITVADMVRAQLMLLDHLGIEILHGSVGASLGGMQSLMLASLAPWRVRRMASISAAAQAHPQSIAMRFVQRQAVMADPNWRSGRYYGAGFPHQGLRVARQIGTITYRSGPEWLERFGRKRVSDGPPRLDEDFQVESYLAHQGDKFCLEYDPNSYLYISKAMDLFDLTNRTDGEDTLLSRIYAPALVIGVASDILFPVWQQRELATLLDASGCPTTYIELDAPYGHDAFLIERRPVGDALKKHLETG